MNKRLKSIPKFANEAEERAFWESPDNDSTEYFDKSKSVQAVFPNLKATTTSISLRLPDALLVPRTVTLLPSRKNIYGVMYPDTGIVAAAREIMPPEGRKLFKNETYVYGQSAELVSLACMDGSYEFNPDELKLAHALDLADFVVWWHRNPDRKPHSVGLLRGDSKNLFYPDFVICMSHMPGDAPLMRLIDPKHDTKDAASKALHASSYYGKVLFLTRVEVNQGVKQFKIVNDNGSLGDVVDYDDLNRLKTWMRSTKPSSQQLEFLN